jgi:hypothetical protein
MSGGEPRSQQARALLVRHPAHIAQYRHRIARFPYVSENECPPRFGKRQIWQNSRLLRCCHCIAIVEPRLSRAREIERLPASKTMQFGKQGSKAFTRPTGQAVRQETCHLRRLRKDLIVGQYRPKLTVNATDTT